MIKDSPKAFIIITLLCLFYCSQAQGDDYGSGGGYQEDEYHYDDPVIDWVQPELIDPFAGVDSQSNDAPTTDSSSTFSDTSLPNTPENSSGEDGEERNQEDGEEKSQEKGEEKENGEEERGESENGEEWQADFPIITPETTTPAPSLDPITIIVEESYYFLVNETFSVNLLIYPTSSADPPIIGIYYSQADGSPLPDWFSQPDSQTLMGVSPIPQNLTLKVQVSNGNYSKEKIFSIIIHDKLAAGTPIPDLTMYFRNNFSFYFLPYEAFTLNFTDLIFTYTLSDGSPLPEWILPLFDILLFAYQDNITLPIDITVHAEDYLANQTASQTFSIVAAKEILFNETKPGFALSSSQEETQLLYNSVLLNNNNILMLWYDINYTLNAWILNQNFELISPATKISDFVIDSQVVALSNGGALISIIKLSSGEPMGYEVYGNIIDNDGRLVTPEFKLIDTTFEFLPYASAVNIENSKSLIIWDNINEDTNNMTVYYKMFDLDSVIFDETKMSSNIPEAKVLPKGLLLPNQNIMISWVSSTNDTHSDIYVQILDPLLAVNVPEFKLNEDYQGFQYSPRLLLLPNGNILVTWLYLTPTFESYTYVAKVIDQQGKTIWNETSMLVGNYTGTLPSIGLEVVSNQYLLLTYYVPCEGNLGVSFWGQLYGLDASIIINGGVLIHDECIAFPIVKPVKLADESLFFSWTNPAGNVYNGYSKVAKIDVKDLVFLPPQPQS